MTAWASPAAAHVATSVQSADDAPADDSSSTGADENPEPFSGTPEANERAHSSLPSARILCVRLAVHAAQELIDTRAVRLSLIHI